MLNSPSRMLPAMGWIAGIVTVGAGAIIVALPMYHDHAIYWRGGELLLEGKPLANDFLVKQPGIYAVFAAARLLLGDHEWSYRLLDAVVQIGIAALLARIAAQLEGRILAGVTYAVYLLTYAASAFVLGSHPESYIGIAVALFVLSRMQSEQNWQQVVVDGVLVTWLVWLKVTFAIAAIAVALADLLSGSSVRVWARHWLGVVGIAVGATALLVGFFTPHIDWSSLPPAVEYMRFYASLPPLTFATLTDIGHRLLRVITENYSVAVSGAAIAGWIFLARTGHPHLLLWALLSIGVALSIIVERKFGVVHLWRMLPLIAIPAAKGFVVAFKNLGDLWRQSALSMRIAVVMPLCLSIALLSPLPRAVMMLRAPLYAAVSPEQYNAAFQRPAHNVLHRQTLWTLCGYLASNRKPNERVLVLSSCMSQLYVFLREPQWYHFSTTLPVMGTFVPKQWRKLYEQDLQQADWLVISTLDRANWLTGHNYSSWEWFCADRLSSEYLRTHFCHVMETDIAKVYRRIIPEVELLSER